MLRFGKGPSGLLAAGLAGLGAWAYYKYSRMSEDQKRDLVNGLKEKGRKLFGNVMPSSSPNNTNTSTQV